MARKETAKCQPWPHSAQLKRQIVALYWAEAQSNSLVKRRPRRRQSQGSRVHYTVLHTFTSTFYNNINLDSSHIVSVLIK